MTLKTDLMEIVTHGENSGVEFKRDTLQNHDLAKELVALSNLQGGMVLLGVDDDGSIVGLTRDRLEEWVMTVCRDKIRPAIIPYFEVIPELRTGKDVAIVRVTRGLYVHSRWHRNRHDYYIRVGSQSRQPSPEELSRLFQRRGAIRADLRPVSGSGLGNLDRRRLKDYLGRVREQPFPKDGDDTGWQSLLGNIEIMVDDSVTLSGMLLFGIKPNRFLPQAGVDAAAFQSSEKDYSTIERATIRGPMTPLMDQAGNLLETGMVEQTLDFIRRNTPVTSQLEDGARRVERPAYPAEAVREAIVNALVHRDYLLADTDVELAVYNDRLEIVSPGKLPNGVTPERMRLGIRASRNQLLKEIMRDYGYVESMGMGVPRKIIRGMRSHNNTDPDLLEDGERFVVRLWRRPDPKDTL